ncbi:hypothetical protein Vretimale_11245, partial [Volvox reticuliferus]
DAGAGSAGGGAASSLARGVGVFSEADVYGMFRTRPWDRSLLHAPGAALLFASPGNITSGVSLEAFRAWAGDPKNLLVLAGYQVRGTLGARLEAIQNQGLQSQSLYRGGGGGGGVSAATVDVPNVPCTASGGGGGGGGGSGSSRVEVRCRIKMLAFSAHADLRGLLGLVRRCGPRAVVLVHGQREPMEFLRARIENHLGIECHAPPTGTTVSISPRRAVPLGVRPQLVSTATCAAGVLAAQSVRMAQAAASPRLYGMSEWRRRRAAGGLSEDGAAGTSRGGVNEDDDSGNHITFENECTADGLLSDPWVNIHRLRPQPMTSLPLSGVIVARVVPNGSQLQPGATAAAAAAAAPSSQPQHPEVVTAAARGGATQLTLTDSNTAAKVLLQAHHAKQQQVTPVSLYNLTYGCTYVVRLPSPLRSNAAPAAEHVPGPDVAEAAAAAAVAVDRLAATATADVLARARAVVSAEVGGYAASRRLQVEMATTTLSFGTFRAQLSVVSDPEFKFLDLMPPHQHIPEGIVTDSPEGSQAGEHQRAAGRDGGGDDGGGDAGDVGGGGCGGDGGGHRSAEDRCRLLLRISCKWSASEDAVASRCLHALRNEFGIADSH